MSRVRIAVPKRFGAARWAHHTLRETLESFGISQLFLDGFLVESSWAARRGLPASCEGTLLLGQITEEGITKSAGLFEQAIEKDPNHARAYAGLANAYNVLGVNHLPLSATTLTLR